jgi:subtilisin-like proprotein convertase family protein
LTKDNINLTLDDDAPVEDDAHLEPALGSIMFLGVHQPDGRGEFIGDGIDSDDRDNMLFSLAGQGSGGAWDLFVGDFRIQGGNESVFRRWSMTIKSPCGAERYVGTAKDLAPGTGICAIELAAGADNLEVLADFAAGDEVVNYRVELVDSMVPGSGMLEITDCNGETTTVAIDLAAASGDVSLPVVTGSVDLEAAQFVGTASDIEAGDTGIEEVELAPFADNIELVSVIDGEGVVNFVVGLIDPAFNGRGYVRAIDGCGLRGYGLVEIDASAPVCSGEVGTKVRYFSGDVSLPIPDNNPAGITTSIVVSDTQIVSDADLTFNITHGFDDDIDMTLISPTTIALFSDIGSTANDFIDTTLDDEADIEIPDSASEGPFTGSYQPEGGPALFGLDGVPASGTYTLRVVDDAAFNLGTFDSWSLLVESASFAQSFDGRAEDSGVHDSGICTVELADGAVNLLLTVDPAFASGDAIVRYLVELDNPALNGTGTVTVTDCAGNTCETPICLRASFPPAAKGDLDGDGDIDLGDYELFAACLDGPVDGMFPCGDACELADFDDDGDVDLEDFAGFQVDFD